MRWEHSTERKRKRKYETEVKRHREQRERSLTEATKGKKRQNEEKTVWREWDWEFYENDATHKSSDSGNPTSPKQNKYEIP